MPQWWTDAEYQAMQANYLKARDEIEVLRQVVAAAADVCALLRPDMPPATRIPVPNAVLAVLCNAVADYNRLSQ